MLKILEFCFANFHVMRHIHLDLQCIFFYSLPISCKYTENGLKIYFKSHYSKIKIKLTQFLLAKLPYCLLHMGIRFDHSLKCYIHHWLTFSIFLVLSYFSSVDCWIDPQSDFPQAAMETNKQKESYITGSWYIILLPVSDIWAVVLQNHIIVYCNPKRANQWI